MTTSCPNPYNDINLDNIRIKLKQGKYILIVVGPTATGKSNLAVLLATLLSAEIISLDSMQVYSGMNIGTGKITRNEMAGIPHHLIDIYSPGETFSAGEFSRLAEEKINQIFTNNGIPVIVGGTGLYLTALLKGLFQTPSRDEKIRKEFEEQERRSGLSALYNELARIDPACAEYIKANDRQRIHRALEIFHVTGRTPSELRKNDGFGEDRYNSIGIGLNFESRKELYHEIETRIDRMFEAGWIDEVRELVKQYPTGIHAFKALGYREIIDYLNGNLDYDNLKNTVKKKTRNFAKRQITWYKKQQGIHWFDASKDKELVCKDILKYIELHLGNMENI